MLDILFSSSETMIKHKENLLFSNKTYLKNILIFSEFNCWETKVWKFFSETPCKKVAIFPALLCASPGQFTNRNNVSFKSIWSSSILSLFCGSKHNRYGVSHKNSLKFSCSYIWWGHCQCRIMVDFSFPPVYHINSLAVSSILVLGVVQILHKHLAAEKGGVSYRVWISHFFYVSHHSHLLFWKLLVKSFKNHVLGRGKGGVCVWYFHAIHEQPLMLPVIS